MANGPKESESYGGKHNLYNAMYSRSPRWTSGSLQMLLALIREFETRRGEVLDLFAKKRDQQLLRAPRVGKHNSTRVGEGRKS